MKTLRETEQRLSNLRTEVDKMQVGRSAAIQGLIAQVNALTAQVTVLQATLAAHMADKKAHKE